MVDLVATAAARAPFAVDARGRVTQSPPALLSLHRCAARRGRSATWAAATRRTTRQRRPGMVSWGFLTTGACVHRGGLAAGTRAALAAATRHRPALLPCRCSDPMDLAYIPSCLGARWCGGLMMNDTTHNLVTAGWNKVFIRCAAPQECPIECRPIECRRASASVSPRFINPPLHRARADCDGLSFTGANMTVRGASRRADCTANAPCRRHA